MKRITCMVILITSLTVVYSQSTQLLDSKNGFKEIKIGSPISDYNVDYVSKDKYLYNGDCCKTFFDAPINKIIIETDENKKVNLIRLSIEFKDERKKDFQYFYDVLVDIFGEQTWVHVEEENGKYTGNSVYHWKANQTYLTWFSDIYFESYSASFKHTVYIGDINLLPSSSNDW